MVKKIWKMSKMEHFWDELTKHDGLIIVKFLGSSIYQFYFTKILLVLFLIIQLSCQMIQINLFVNELSVLEFIQYSSAFFAMFYPILCAIILLIDPKLVENLFKEIKMWPIDNASDITKRKIRREMKIVSFFTIFNTVIALLLGFAFFIFDSYDYTTFLPIKYFTDYYPKYSNILTNIYKCTLVVVFIGTSQSYQAIYYTQHFKYQIWILIDLIADIMRREQYDVLEGSFIDDHEYQQQIKLKLIDVVKRHQELLTAGRKKINEMRNNIAYFSVSGLLIVTSIIFVMATDAFFSYDYRYAPIMSLCVILTVGSAMMAGQSIETITDNAYYLLQQLDWYNMNIENRKIYLIILTCAQRKVAIKFSENYSVNYALGLAVVRGGYSVMSLLAGFKD